MCTITEWWHRAKNSNPSWLKSLSLEINWRVWLTWLDKSVPMAIILLTTCRQTVVVDIWAVSDLFHTSRSPWTEKKAVSLTLSKQQVCIYTILQHLCCRLSVEQSRMCTVWQNWLKVYRSLMAWCNCAYHRLPVSGMYAFAVFIQFYHWYV